MDRRPKRAVTTTVLIHQPKTSSLIFIRIFGHLHHLTVVDLLKVVLEFFCILSNEVGKKICISAGFKPLLISKLFTRSHVIQAGLLLNTPAADFCLCPRLPKKPFYHFELIEGFFGRRG